RRAAARSAGHRAHAEARASSERWVGVNHEAPTARADLRLARLPFELEGERVRPAGLEPATFGSATPRPAVQLAPALPGRSLPNSEAAEPPSCFVRLAPVRPGRLAGMWAGTWARRGAKPNAHLKAPRTRADAGAGHARRPRSLRGSARRSRGHRRIARC